MMRFKYHHTPMKTGGNNFTPSRSSGLVPQHYKPRNHGEVPGLLRGRMDGREVWGPESPEFRALSPRPCRRCERWYPPTAEVSPAWPRTPGAQPATLEANWVLQEEQKPSGRQTGLLMPPAFKVPSPMPIKTAVHEKRCYSQSLGPR